MATAGGSNSVVNQRHITQPEVAITEIVAEGVRLGLMRRDLAIDGRFSTEAMTNGELLVVVVRDKRDKNQLLCGAEIKDHQKPLTPDLRRMYYSLGDELAARVKKVLKPIKAKTKKKKR